MKIIKNNLRIFLKQRKFEFFFFGEVVKNFNGNSFLVFKIKECKAHHEVSQKLPE